MVLPLVLLCRKYQYSQRPPWTHSFAAVLSPAGARTGFTRWANRGRIGFKDAKTMQGYITASIQVQTQPLTSAASRWDSSSAAIDPCQLQTCRRVHNRTHKIGESYNFLPRRIGRYIIALHRLAISAVKRPIPLWR